MVYTFTRTVVWVEFHEVKQDVLLKIGEIIAAHGAEIAFPTRTLHLLREQPGDFDGDAERRSDDQADAPTRDADRAPP